MPDIEEPCCGDGGGGSGAWGAITGTLSDQTDLWTVLGYRQAPSWTYTATELGDGLFTANSGMPSGTTTIILSASVLGSFSNLWSALGSSFVIIFTDATGISSSLIVTACVDSSSNAQLTIGSVSGAGSSVSWSGAYTVTFAPIPFGGSGSVVAVKSAPKTDTFTTTSGTFVDVPDLSIPHTPSSTENKVLLRAVLCVSQASIGGYAVSAQFTRGGTPVGVPASSGDRLSVGAAVNHLNDYEISSLVLEFLDSPNTASETTWAVQVCTQANGGTACVNRRGADTDSANVQRGISTLTIMEVLP